MTMTFGLDLGKQFALRLLQIVKKPGRVLKYSGIIRESSSQFLGDRIVKERNVLIEIGQTSSSLSGLRNVTSRF